MRPPSAGDPHRGGGVGGEPAAVEHAAEVGRSGQGGGEDEVLSPGEGQGQRVEAEQGGRLGDPGGEGDGGVVDLDPDPGRLGQVEGVAGQAVGQVDHGRRPRPGQGDAHGQGGLGPAVGGGQAGNRPSSSGPPGRRGAEQGQPGRGRPQRAGDDQAVPGPGPRPEHRALGLPEGGHGQGQGRAGGDVAPDQRHPERPAGLADPGVDPLEGRHGGRLGHGQGEHQPAGLGGHRGQVGEVGRDRLPAPVLGLGQLGGEVQPLDEHVGGDDQPVPPGRQQHGGVVADPGLDPGPGLQPPGEPGDQPELTQLGRGLS